MTDNIVHFLMPDGTKVSNDPRFDQAEALQKALDATPNTGTAGVGVDEEEAQRIATHEATLDPSDPTANLHGVLGSPAQQIQKEDAKTAKEAGASPANTSTDDPAPIDSNEAVLEVRRKRREAAEAALADAEQTEGDPDQPYEEWTVPQLKLEVAKRNEGRDEADVLVLKGKKKPAVAEMLREDDAAHEGDDNEDDGSGDGDDGSDKE